MLVVELFNSAIEATVDRVSLERHLLAKRAKDIGKRRSDAEPAESCAGGVLVPP